MNLKAILLSIGCFLLFIIIGFIICFIDSKLSNETKRKVDDKLDTICNVAGIFFLYLLLGALSGGAGYILLPLYFVGINVIIYL